MLTARLYVASPDARRLEKLFLQSPLFVPLGGHESGAQALQGVLDLAPDLLILDSALSGMDGLALLDALRRLMAAPPRVLFLSRLPGPTWAERAREKGADLVIAWPAKEAELLTTAAACASIPLPALAASQEAARQEIARGLLARLGVPERLVGRRYMQEAAACAACAPQLLGSYTGILYPFLAERFATSPQAVERAVRTAVEHTWLHGDLPAIQALFGFSVDAERGKPTNAEFLSMLTEHVRREVSRRLSASGLISSSQV